MRARWALLRFLGPASAVRSQRTVVVETGESSAAPCKARSLILAAARGALHWSHPEPTVFARLAPLGKSGDPVA